MDRVIGSRRLDGTDFSGPDACEMYANVVRSCRLESRASSLRRRGFLDGCRPVGGLVAAGVGTAFAMRDGDRLFPDRGSTALLLARGDPVADLLVAPPTDPARHADLDTSVFPRLGAAAATLPAAVGATVAADRTGTGGVAVACLDAAATAEGDFHEACNFAGVFDAPCVFVCLNDGTATTAAPTVASTATAYGFEGVRVDGTDPLAVATVVESALVSAERDSPVLVEAVGDTSAAAARSRFGAWLKEEGVVDASFAAETREAADAELDRAVAAAEERPDAPDVFEHVYADLTPELRAQRAERGTAATGADPN
jgi:pyruvate dehydrogenase E1 component alpha subunit